MTFLGFGWRDAARSRWWRRYGSMEQPEQRSRRGLCCWWMGPAPKRQQRRLGRRAERELRSRSDVGWVSSAAYCRSGRSDPDHDGHWSLSPSCIHLWNVAGKSGTMNSRKKSVVTIQKRTSPIHVLNNLLRLLYTT